MSIYYIGIPQYCMFPRQYERGEKFYSVHRVNLLHDWYLRCILHWSPLTASWKLKRRSEKCNFGTDQVSLPLFCMLCSAALPALAACVIIPSNLICWVYDSITPLPLKAVGYLVLIFFVSCLPLSYAGAYLAARRSNATRVSFRDIGMHQIKAIFTDDTDNTSKIVQFSPSSILSALVAGIVPFGIIHFETEYIYRVLWLEKTTFYFYYGFLFFQYITPLCYSV